MVVRATLVCRIAEMKYETATIASLMLDPANVRTHDSKNLEAIKASLARFGQQKPIVVDGKGIIVAGNGTMMAAKMLNWSSVEIVRTNLEGAEAIAYAIADNRTAELAGWDEAALAQQLAALQIDDEELANIAGFTDAEIEAMILDGKEIEEDEVPEPPVDPITKTGDLWLLGTHRVLCGDSTNAEDVGRLMNGAKAALISTDPPYGVAYGVETGQSTKFDAIANDENDGPRLQAFLESIFKTAIPHMNDNAAWYLWHAQLTQGFFAAAAAAAAAAVLIHRQIIWVKPSLVLGHGDYHWRHELCFYGWVKGNRAPWYGDRKQTTVWEIGRENDHIHPTQKPVELFARPMQFNTKVGEVCYEPFAGSGTQFIAAEQLNRKCYGMEISPAYCDVIVKRWETLTGKTATLST